MPPGLAKVSPHAEGALAPAAPQARQPPLMASNSQVAAMQAALQAAVQAAGAQPTANQLIELAWHHRQRDTARALAWATQAQEVCPLNDNASAAALSLHARAALVRAEAAWLVSDLAPAEAAADEAEALFARAQDAIGQGDVCWLRASLEASRGRSECTAPRLQEAAGLYRRGGDPLREQLATLAQLTGLALRDVAAAREGLRASGLDSAQPQHRSLTPWLELLRGCLLMQEGEAARSLPHNMRAHEAALEFGLLRVAILTASNVGVQLLALNDAASALDWQERALRLARPTGWATVIGTCSLHLCDALCALGRHERALALINDAMPLFLEGTHAEAQAWLVKATVHRAMGHPAEAAPCYDQALARLTRLQAHQTALEAQIGAIDVALMLGQIDPARRLCTAALADARRLGMRIDESQLLARLARCCTEQPTARRYLLQAVHVARSIEGYRVPTELLEALADAHLAAGDAVAALTLVREASADQQRQHHIDINNRIAALEVQHETTRLRLESRHLRQLGQTQQQRADQLARANATLEQLGEIGRDITARLNPGDIVKALAGHMGGLTQGHGLVVWQFDAPRSVLKRRFDLRTGQAAGPAEVALNDPQHPVARCARLGGELQWPADQAGAHPDAPCQLLNPLMVSECLRGVMTLEFARSADCTERERAILRTLCAYGAIALVNADAQLELLNKNFELERLVSTDLLTGLFNRRHLDAALHRELSLAQRQGLPLSLIAIDVDHFKAINDQHGHPAGDQALSRIGSLLSAHVRNTDVVGRWGGEEFVVVCPGASLEMATQVAENLRRCIAECDLGVNASATASFGVAALHLGDTVHTLSSRADQALYSAKAAGRNCVRAEG